MTEKRFTITQDFEEHHRQIRDNGHIIMGCFVEPQAEVIVDFLNQLNDENEQLKQSVNNLKDTIIKITIAYQRKYDRTIVDLVDEVHDEDITDLIKELKE